MLAWQKYFLAPCITTSVTQIYKVKAMAICPYLTSKEA